MFPVPSGDFKLSNMTALSPLDGRYWEKFKDLAGIMGEYGLNTIGSLLSEDAKSFLQCLTHNFNEDDVTEIKRFEMIINHDVKAVEYFLKHKCQSNAKISKVVNCDFCFEF
ncbi:hypothetical protein RYX36_021997 [Vicia faba]